MKNEFESNVNDKEKMMKDLNVQISNQQKRI